MSLFRIKAPDRFVEVPELDPLRQPDIVKRKCSVTCIIVCLNVFYCFCSYLGYDTRAFAVSKGSLVEGVDYKVSLTVSGGGFAPTTVSLFRFVNYLPYNGDCTLNALDGNQKLLYLKSHQIPSK